MALANANTYGVKSGEICRESTAAQMAMDFFGGEIFWVCLQNRSLQTAVTPTVWLFLVTLLFFLAPSHLYTSQLCWSGLGETKAGPSCSAMKGWGSWLFTQLWQGEPFLAGKFPLGTEQYWFEGQDDAGKMKLSSFPPCAVILRFFVPLCHWSFFLSIIQSCPRAVFVHG